MNIPLFYWQHIDAPVYHHLRTIHIRDDLLGWVVSGQKKVLTPHRPLDATIFKAGDVFVLPRGTQWDVINDPSPQGRYQAHILLLTPSLVDGFHQQFPQFSAMPHIHTGVRLPAADSIRQALRHTLDGLSNRSTPLSLALQHHRVMELLLSLAEAGHVFAQPSALGWIEQVRRRVAQRPHADWSVQELAASFHISASTLRRRLQGEGQSLASCVREVRLETALSLLQTTHLPVADIAQRCGYASHSRFSAAFRDRFGFVPSHLRPLPAHSPLHMCKPHHSLS